MVKEQPGNVSLDSFQNESAQCARQFLPSLLYLGSFMSTPSSVTQELQTKGRYLLQAIIDGTYLVLWILVHRGLEWVIETINPQGLLHWMVLGSQAIFIAAGFAIIVLFTVRDVVEIKRRIF
jgi:hypothetical protein